MLDIIYRLASTKIINAWDSDGIQIDVINDGDFGLDQDSANTHNNLKLDDLDKTNQENKEPLELELPSHDL